MLRKKLEEDDEIDAWLSKFTGSTHPKRGIRIKVYHSDLQINLEIQHIASAIIDNANQKMPTVFVLSFDGTITAFQFPLQHLNVIRSTPRKTRFSSIRNVLSMSNKFIIYEPDSPDVVEIDAKTAKSITIETEFTRIDHIAVDENLTAVCGNDTLVSVFIDDEQLFELQLFRDSPSCIAVSESFHAIVCCTNEGIVLIYSATDGSLAHVIDIGRCQIRNVCITKNFGIICCHTFKDGVQARHSLIFLTINGEMISELEINEAVSMSTFSSAEGADYIVYVQERGRIVVVNTATQENEVINRKSNGKRVLGFVYSSSISSIQIVTSDGVFYSLPVSV